MQTHMPSYYRRNLPAPRPSDSLRRGLLSTLTSPAGPAPCEFPGGTCLDCVPTRDNGIIIVEDSLEIPPGMPSTSKHDYGHSATQCSELDNALGLERVPYSTPPLSRTTSPLNTESPPPDAPPSAESSNVEDNSIPSSPKSAVSSRSLASSSSATSFHSSYSTTYKAAPPSSDPEAERDRPKRISRGSARIETRQQAANYRPAGPAHLEHAYSCARAEFRTALITAAHQLFGFSVPVRNSEMEARRPTPEKYALLRAHPLVKHVAGKLNRIDAALERAISKGRLWDNTPIPEEYRWTEEKLAEYGWAYLPPEQPVVKKKEKREREEASVEPRITRGAKRRAEAGEGAEVDPASDEASAGEEVEANESEEEPPRKRHRRGRPSKVVESDEEDEASDLGSATSDSPPAKASIVTKASPPSNRSSASESPAPMKRKRGRPPKIKQPENEAKAEAPPAKADIRKVSKEAETPEKRKRGRPRKDTLPPTPPPSDSDARRKGLLKRLRRR